MEAVDLDLQVDFPVLRGRHRKPWVVLAKTCIYAHVSLVPLLELLHIRSWNSTDTVLLLYFLLFFFILAYQIFSPEILCQ